MRIEIKGLIAALIAAAAVLGVTFGLSAIMVGRNHEAPFQTMSGSMQSDRRNMSKSMESDKQRMASSMSASDQLAQGHAFFTRSCASCHGSNGQGAFGPSLHHEDMNDAKIAQTIKNGVQGKMPAFAGKYNDTQVQATVAYIRSLQ